MQLHKLAGFPVIKLTAISCTYLANDRPQTTRKKVVCPLVYNGNGLTNCMNATDSSRIKNLTPLHLWGSIWCDLQ